MPSIIGFVTEEQLEEIDKQVANNRYEDRSEFVQKAVERQLYAKHNFEL